VVEIEIPFRAVERPEAQGEVEYEGANTHH
jgi:hypothetical protein